MVGFLIDSKPGIPIPAGCGCRCLLSGVLVRPRRLCLGLGLEDDLVFM